MSIIWTLYMYIFFMVVMTSNVRCFTTVS